MSFYSRSQINALIIAAAAIISLAIVGVASILWHLIQWWATQP